MEVEIKSLRRRVKANLRNAREFREAGDREACLIALECLKERRRQLYRKLNENF